MQVWLYLNTAQKRLDIGRINALLIELGRTHPTVEQRYRDQIF